MAGVIHTFWTGFIIKTISCFGNYLLGSNSERFLIKAVFNIYIKRLNATTISLLN